MSIAIHLIYKRKWAHHIYIFIMFLCVVVFHNASLVALKRGKTKNCQRNRDGVKDGEVLTRYNVYR